MTFPVQSMNQHFDMMVTASLQALQVVDTPWAGLSAAPDQTAKGLQTSFLNPYVNVWNLWGTF